MTRQEFVQSQLLRAPSPWRSAVIMAVLITSASILRLAFGMAADYLPFVTYFPAIVIVALLAGWRAGVVSIFISIAVVKLVFWRARDAAFGDWQMMAMMGLFVLSCLMLVAIAQTLRVTVARLQDANNRAEFINRELMHRVRNSLVIVNALAALTYKSDPMGFMPIFTKRMNAMARGLDILSRNGADQCDLREIVEIACEPFMQDNRIEVLGSTGDLAGASCVPLTLAVHELCTNALKHGALSVPGGRVTIELEIDQTYHEASLLWKETGGPAVRRPVHQGLGSALLVHPSLGPAILSFEPDGLKCQMRLKLAVAALAPSD